jgi:tryptophan synthase alpha chain
MSGIERIQQSFNNKKAFIGYLTAGDGGIHHTLNAALALIEGGINILEIGVPFSDPIADGPVIQRAATRALAAGTTLQDVLWLAAEIRKKSDIPLVLFSYLNPILATLQPAFFKHLQQAGIDGMLIVDCPIEESSLFHQACLDHEIAPIYVITPSTPIARIKKIAQHGIGFIYYACRKGTTGIRTALPTDFQDKMKLLQNNISLPMVVGFGIGEFDLAKQVLQLADGVVMGSVFVKALEENLPLTELTKMARQINPLTRLQS